MRYNKEVKQFIEALGEKLSKYDVKYDAAASDAFQIAFKYGKSWPKPVVGSTSLYVYAGELGCRLCKLDKHYNVQHVYRKSVLSKCEYMVRSAYGVNNQNDKLELYNSYDRVVGVVNLAKYIKSIKKVFDALVKIDKLIEHR